MALGIGNMLEELHDQVPRMQRLVAAPERLANVVREVFDGPPGPPVRSAARLYAAIMRARKEIDEYGNWWEKYRMQLEALGYGPVMRKIMSAFEGGMPEPDSLHEGVLDIVARVVRTQDMPDADLPEGWGRIDVMRLNMALHAMALNTHQSALYLRVGRYLRTGDSLLKPEYLGCCIHLLGIENVLWGFPLDAHRGPSGMGLEVARRARRFVTDPPPVLPVLVAIRGDWEFSGYAGWAYVSQIPNPYRGDDHEGLRKDIAAIIVKVVNSPREFYLSRR